MYRTILATATAFVCAAAVVSAVGPKPVAARAAAKDSSVTLTGCLKAEGTRYVLTDLQGVNVPKARTWKTGYLRKTSRRYEVVSASGLKLREHVGHQVTVSGTADGGSQLRARTVKVVSASCS
jgi:hypothetical protein